MSRRFLLVQFADIGDLVLTTPAIFALRDAHPDAFIAVLTSSHAAPVLPDIVDEVITFDKQQFNGTFALLHPANRHRIAELKQYQFDTVIFCHHFTLKLGTLKFWLIARASGAATRIGLQNGNGWFLTDSIPDDGYGAKHQAQYWLDLVALAGASSQPRATQIRTSPDETLLSGTDGKPLIIMHAGSGGYSLARRWEPESFAAVGDALVENHGATVVLVGGPDDDSTAVARSMHCPALDLTGKTASLSDLAGLIDHADLFIGADSGVMHIATATGTPTIAIFGPSNHDAWAPWAVHKPAVVLRSDPICSPCSYVSHEIGLRDGCPARTCMRMVTPEQVVNAAEKLLAGETPVAESRNPQVNRTWNRVNILGLPVDGITYDAWLDQIDTWIADDSGLHQVCTINPEFTMIAQKDINFRNILCRVALCVPDGVGMLWAARRMGKHLPERVTGSDGVPLIAEHAAKRGWKLFFLGAAPGIADRAADILREKHPGLQIVGTHSGSPALEEEDAIVELVNAADADILLVAFGAPRQDKWIARNSPRLNVSMAMGVGGTFDFIAGIIPRAPVWMQKLGIEWLYRLIRQPSRVMRMTRLPRFVIAVLLRGEK